MRIRATAVMAVLLGGSNVAAVANSVYLGEGEIAATALDQSGLKGLLEDGATPRAQIGGLGGAIAYSGQGDIYYAVPDRGPGAGETTYISRLYKLELRLRETDSKFRLEPRLMATRLLSDEAGHHMTGDASAYDAVNSPASLRMDSEGLRVSPDGKSVFISDEYGPFIHQFEIASGRRLKSLPIPNKFHIDYPSKYVREELNRNLVGRQSNRGLEALAITPDSRRLVSLIQDPLIQDCHRDNENKLTGLYNRILDIDLKTGAIHEFAYALEDPRNGVSEILALNDHQFLVLERDSKAGSEARDKKLHLIDLNGASDIHGLKSLTEQALAEEKAQGTPPFTPVQKRPFLDILAQGISAIPEKIEGMAFGPDLADGRRLLILSSDNDFSKTENTRFFAFAVDRTDLPDFHSQEFHLAKTGDKR